MAKFCPLFSGSTANSTYIGGSFGGILIDAGSSFLSLKNEFLQNQLDLSTLRAVLITHSHSDHTKGLSALLKKVHIPVVASMDTLNYLDDHNMLPEGAQVLEIGEKAMDICGTCVSFFKTSHDALGSGGYTLILPDGNKISVCTDLGVVTDEVRQALTGSQLIMLESNHDLKMLKSGPYPPELKMRIMGEKGHLSNISAAAELKYLFQKGTNRFVLAHLSQHNNLPRLAFTSATASLLDLGAKVDEDYILKVAAPKNNGVIYL